MWPVATHRAGPSGSQRSELGRPALAQDRIAFRSNVSVLRLYYAHGLSAHPVEVVGRRLFEPDGGLLELTCAVAGDVSRCSRPRPTNGVGLRMAQLYNKTLVYNHKRHGVFQLGNWWFDFRMKSRFPKKLTPAFLYVDLLNNLDELA